MDGAGKSALVAGCGLGDDAEELTVNRPDFQVTAFGNSPSAIAIAAKPFLNSEVKFVTANPFQPPVDWTRTDDLVSRDSAA